MKQIAVLMGGISAEREVSLASGKAIAAALDRCGYGVIRVDVQSKKFELPEGVDLVFIALHGTFGEDGQVQEVLDARGIPYVGADAAASRIAFDKILSKELFRKHGIPTADYEVLQAGGERTLPLPVVVKPPRQGSSFGIAKVADEKEWQAALDEALKFDGEVLVEAFVAGRELTVGIVGEDVFPVIEIKAPQGHYDYAAKYTKGKTEYLCPAPLDEKTASECQTIARKAYEVLGIDDLGRVDFRLNDAGELFVLELNTIPGFTETSLLPKAAQAAGVTFDALCRRIVERKLG